MPNSVDYSGSTVLVVGENALATKLATALEELGPDIERAGSALAAEVMHVAAPDLVVLGTDATAECGHAMFDEIVGSAGERPKLLLLCSPWRAAQLELGDAPGVGVLDPRLGVAGLVKIVGQVLQFDNTPVGLQGMDAFMATLQSRARPQTPAGSAKNVGARAAVERSVPVPSNAGTKPAATSPAFSSIDAKPAEADRSSAAPERLRLQPPPVAAVSRANTVAKVPAAIASAPTAAVSMHHAGPTPLSALLTNARAAQAPMPSSGQSRLGQPGKPSKPQLEVFEEERTVAVLAQGSLEAESRLASSSEGQLEVFEEERTVASVVKVPVEAFAAERQFASSSEELLEIFEEEKTPASPERMSVLAGLSIAPERIVQSSAAQFSSQATVEPLGAITAPAPAPVTTAPAPPLQTMRAVFGKRLEQWRTRLPSSDALGTGVQRVVIVIQQSGRSVGRAAIGRLRQVVERLERFSGSRIRVPQLLAGAAAGLVLPLTLWTFVGGATPNHTLALATVQISGSLRVAKDEPVVAQPEEDGIGDDEGLAAEEEDSDSEDDEQDVVERHQRRKAVSGIVEAARGLVRQGKERLGQRRFGMAEAAYLMALKRISKYPPALAGLVKVHLARKDGREAVRWAKRLVARQPIRSVNHLLLGDAYALRGNKAAAKKAWQRAAHAGSSIARRRLAKHR